MLDAPWHWVILAAVVIALFGYKKLPEASRALGRSLRIFKTEIKGMSDDDKARAEARETAAVPPEPAAIEPVRDTPVSTPISTPVSTPTSTPVPPLQKPTVTTPVTPTDGAPNPTQD